jgi:hypothetical protein
VLSYWQQPQQGLQQIQLLLLAVWESSHIQLQSQRLLHRHQLPVAQA